MQKNEDCRHRKPIFANPNCKDPAIILIYEGLSALCNEEERHDMSSSGQPQSSVMAHFKNHPHSGIGSDEKEVAHGSGTRHFVSSYGQVEPCDVMDQFSSSTGACPLLPPPAGSNIQSKPKYPTSISTSSRFSPPQTEPRDTWLALVSPSQPYRGNENKFLQRSPNILTVDSRSWPIPSSTDCPAESPKRPTRQPRGPQDAAHDTGFAWDTYERHRDTTKAAANSPESEPQFNPTWLTTPTFEFAGNRTFPPQVLDKDPEPRIQFQPNISRREFPQSENSSPSFHISSQPTYRPIPFSNGDMDVFTDQSPTISTNQSMNFDSSAFNSQNQLVAYVPTSSGTLATMSEDQGQMVPQTPTVIRSPTKPFIPSTMALTEAGRGTRDPARMPAGSKYQGDAFSRSYLRQVPGLPDHLNTSLWLKGLPPDVQPYQILDIIQCGSVWSLDLKPPTKDHVTVAATLTFMTPYAAAMFLGHCQFHGLRLGEYWISASYNKFGIPEISTTESRVLNIEGPSNLMTPQHWELQFKKACRFQMDRWSYLPSSIPGRARMEFRFVRVDGQAQSCRQMIERELGYLGITVRYGMDPCGRIEY